MFTASTQNAHLGEIIVKSFINWSQGGTGLGYLDRDYVLMNQDDGSLIYVGFNGISFAKSSFTNPSGADVAVYQKQVFFNAKTGTQSIIFTTVSDLKDSLLPHESTINR